MLKLFYITNNPEIAKIAQSAGVDRIFVDMEYIGKAKRQGGMNTVQNHHTVSDIKAVRKVIDKAELLVRVNPIHENSKQEIDDVIAAGADVIMLPMWKTADEVKSFVQIVNGRAKTLPLLETEEARLCLDEVLELDGIDEMYIGLNDLHLSQGKKFMFELLVDGTVNGIAGKLKKKNIPFGIGGVGRVFSGATLPAENILAEHYRLGSSMVILARAFCDQTKCTLAEFESIMTKGIIENKKFEKELQAKDKDYFVNKHNETAEIIRQIVSEK
ncbi:MAG: aldolase/citrate lyase family protein [Eubacteriales bacterium]|nr:aldolase/citrate lyase family protein [Eubacteriales bacterium]